jgi:hypothetical protein
LRHGSQAAQVSEKHRRDRLIEGGIKRYSPLAARLILPELLLWTLRTLLGPWEESATLLLVDLRRD